MYKGLLNFTREILILRLIKMKGNFVAVKQPLTGQNNTALYYVGFIIFCVMLMLFSKSTFAADIFASNKAAIQDATTSDSSTVHYIIEAAAFLGAAAWGGLKHDWPKAIVSFIVFNLFWTFGTHMFS